jgi:hypothetical protein
MRDLVIRLKWGGIGAGITDGILALRLSVLGVSVLKSSFAYSTIFQRRDAEYARTIIES